VLRELLVLLLEPISQLLLVVMQAQQALAQDQLLALKKLIKCSK
jgi:hypothetical protein